jgi:itaconyl-CoA hydratase
MASNEGWRGRFWEDFEVGGVHQHSLGRTINAADNSWSTPVTRLQANG